MVGNQESLSRALSLVASLPTDTDRRFVAAIVAAMEDIVGIFSEVVKVHESQFQLSGNKVGLFSEVIPWEVRC